MLLAAGLCRCLQILSGVTGVRHAKDMAGKLLGGNYCLTGDSMLKMLAIYVRVLCGIPVVLMSVRATELSNHLWPV